MFQLGNIKFFVTEDERLKTEIYKLRYKVYVEEFKFEKPEDHPNGLEKDIYDESSIHFVGVDAETGEVIATMRLIKYSEAGFPLEHVEGIRFVGSKADLENIVEVSRFAVDNRYRRRREDVLFKGVEVKKGEFDRRKNQRDNNDRRQKPIVVYGMYRLMYQEAKKLGANNWIMISEKHLHNALSQMGFLWHQIGNEVDYHGTRAPYIGFIDENEESWLTSREELCLFFTEGLEKQFWPKDRRYAKLISKSINRMFETVDNTCYA